MQVVSDERKNIILEDAAIPAGLDRLDLILEADAKRKDGVLKQRLDNIDAMIAYIMNVLDDDDDDDDEDFEPFGPDDDPHGHIVIPPPEGWEPDFDDDDGAADEVPKRRIDVPVPDYTNVDHLNDDPYADIDIPPPEGWEPDLDDDDDDDDDEDFEPFGPDDDPHGHIVIPPPEGWEPDFDDDDLDNREQWRVVDGFPLYEVLHDGRVRNAITKHVLKPCLHTSGYLIVSLSHHGGAKTLYVHRLVAMAWLPNPDHKPQVDHIDGDKRNNMLNNLRWCTPVENMQNRGASRLNTTGYKGVDFYRGRYRARITVNRRRIFLGYFDTAAEAGAAYDAAALRWHGVFARGGLH